MRAVTIRVPRPLRVGARPRCSWLDRELGQPAGAGSCCFHNEKLELGQGRADIEQDVRSSPRGNRRKPEARSDRSGLSQPRDRAVRPRAIGIAVGREASRAGRSDRQREADFSEKDWPKCRRPFIIRTSTRPCPSSRSGQMPSPTRLPRAKGRSLPVEGPDLRAHRFHLPPTHRGRRTHPGNGTCSVGDWNKAGSQQALMKGSRGLVGNAHLFQLVETGPPGWHPNHQGAAPVDREDHQ